jgi:DNA-binding NarL/FixJ family response regulator
MSIRVLVVDDQELVRAGFIMILNTQDDIHVVGEAVNGSDAVDAATRLRPDVVLIDIRVPIMDGLEATRTLRARAIHARVLILTTFDPDEYVYKALKSGASGFVLKDIPPNELLAAVRVVAKGEALLAPSITQRLIAQFAERLSPPQASQELERLTDREGEVLRFMAKGHSNSEIAEQLFLSPTTIKSHVASVLAKLGLRDRVQAVVFAYENGIVRPGSTLRQTADASPKPRSLEGSSD